MNIQTNANDFINAVVLTNDVNEYNGGLTKREHFAAMALQGLCLNYWNKPLTARILASESVIIADELIHALNETK